MVLSVKLPSFIRELLYRLVVHEKWRGFLCLNDIVFQVCVAVTVAAMGVTAATEEEVSRGGDE